MKDKRIAHLERRVRDCEKNAADLIQENAILSAALEYNKRIVESQQRTIDILQEKYDTLFVKYMKWISLMKKMKGKYQEASQCAVKIRCNYSREMKQMLTEMKNRKI